MENSKIDDSLIPPGLLANAISEYDSITRNCFFLTFKDSTSDKFWAAVPDNGKILTMWGRNGKPPQGSKLITLSDATQKLKEKFNKGYKLSTSNVLLNTFQNNMKWFSNVNSSQEFKNRMIGIELAKELDKPLEKKRKMSI